jgi:hypothetical protein
MYVMYVSYICMYDVYMVNIYTDRYRYEYAYEILIFGLLKKKKKAEPVEERMSTRNLEIENRIFNNKPFFV